MGLLGSLGGIIGGVAGNWLLPGVGGAIGSAIGGSLGGSGGGGGGGGGSTGGQNTAYIPTQRPETDANFIAARDQYQQAINSIYGTTNPYNQQLLQGQFNNPYYQQALNAAGQASNAYINAGANTTNLANRGFGNANAAYDQAQRSSALLGDILPSVQGTTRDLYNQIGTSNQQYQNLINYQNSQLGNITQSQGNLYSGGNQVLQTALDPQNALYNRTAQQLTDQTRAAEYARGIQSSPLGASVESNALGNFNIDWQNQQLARQSQGLSAAQGAYGSAQGMGNAYTQNVAGLQAGQNQQMLGLTEGAQQNYLNYVQAANQSALAGTQNVNAASQGAANLAAQGAQNTFTAGQLPNSVYQQNYGYQNQALQNYLANNQGYLSGLNQIQSNDLGYLNFGQSAQNQAFNQNAYNQQQQQNAIGQIAGQFANPNSGLSQFGNTVRGWFGGGTGGSPYTPPPDNYQWGTDISSPYVTG